MEGEVEEAEAFALCRLGPKWRKWRRPEGVCTLQVEALVRTRSSDRAEWGRRVTFAFVWRLRLGVSAT
jgi:hypothetical protein